MLVISVVAGLLISIFGGAENVMDAAGMLAGFIFVFLAVGMIVFSNSFGGRIAKKTMERGTQEAGFGVYSTFTSDGSGTIGSVLRIDENTGRIGYVSYQNPYEFQLVLAKDITKIKSSYIKGPFGGTSYVYFEFYYNNKRTRIPTFTSNSQFHVQSEEVLNGISKADAFCEILENAQKA